MRRYTRTAEEPGNLLHSYRRLGEKVKSGAEKCVFRAVNGGGEVIGHLVFGTYLKSKQRSSGGRLVQVEG